MESMVEKIIVDNLTRQTSTIDRLSEIVMKTSNESAAATATMQQLIFGLDKWRMELGEKYDKLDADVKFTQKTMMTVVSDAMKSTNDFQAQVLSIMRSQARPREEQSVVEDLEDAKAGFGFGRRVLSWVSSVGGGIAILYMGWQWFISHFH